MLAAMLAASLPLVPASDEKSWLHVPGEGEFRTQAIARVDNEEGWPFAVDEGFLACAYILGTPAAYFVEKTPNEAETPRVLILSTNPFDLAFGNIAASGLYAPFETLEKLIPLIAPFAQAGEKLCDQPQGAEIGPGEL